MRSGTAKPAAWHTRAIAAVAGVEREPISVQVSREIGGGGIPGENAMAAASGSVTFAPLRTVAAGPTPSPWRRSGTWPPMPGDAAVISVGSVEGGTYSALSGVVDSISGDPVTGQLSASVIDPVDPLHKKITIPPLMASLPSSVEGGDHLNVGLMSDYIVDRALRACSVFSTPYMPATVNGVSVPGQGSALPARGTVTAAGQQTDQTLAVDFYSAPWGWGIYDCDASYTTAGTVAMADGFEFSCMVAPWHAGASSVTAYLTGRSEYFKLTISATRSVSVDYYNGTTATTVAYLAPADGWTRVSGRVSSGSCTITTDDGRTNSGTHGAASAITTAAVSSVRILVARTGCIGGVIAANIPLGYYAGQVLNARLYSGTTLNPKIVASPSIVSRDALDLIAEIADATCRAFWWTEDGLFTWMPGDVLLGRAAVTDITAKSDLADFGWDQSLSDVFSQVVVEYQAPSIARSKITTVELWRGSGQTTAGTDEQFITPSGDEDWFNLGTPTQLLTANIAAFNTGPGSWYGATTDAGALVTDPALSVVLTAVGPATWKLRTYANAVYDQKVPDLAAVKKWKQGESLPVLRGKARTTWADATATAGAGPTGAAEYAHNGGRWIQGYVNETPALIATFLASWLCVARTHATGVRIKHDPRLQVGDVVNVVGDWALGVTLTALITRIEQTTTPTSQDMNVDLFVISTTSTGVTYDELNAEYATYSAVDAPVRTYDALT